MAEDWLADVRKYAANADEAIVAGLVTYLGIALRKRDSSLVAFSDSKETDRVRENFLKKKLALTDADSVLDAAIAAVGQTMKADRTKNRVTVYYLLADNFGKLEMFRKKTKAAGAAKAPAAAKAPVAAKAPAAAKPRASAKSGGAAAPLAAAGLAGAGAVSAPQAAAATPPASVPAADPPVAKAADAGAVAGGVAGGAAAASAAAATAAPAAAQGVADLSSAASGDSGGAGATGAAASHSADHGHASDDDSGGVMGWLLWLLLALAIAALLWWLWTSMRGNDAAKTNQASANVAAAAPANNASAPVTMNGVAGAGEASVPAAAPAVPQGSGVIAGTRESRPMLTVYFDTGRSEVSNDLAAASAALRDYLAANPGARLSVSGFNDPTGNAAANAALSRNRATRVSEALAAAGIPAASIDLDRPADTTGSTTDMAAARRVEVTIKQ